ncbi:MAG: hypothetical protein KGZ94_05035 [Clostridia bacterium]|nr:hypothetical protein [Clostridia bacterium]
MLTVKKAKSCQEGDQGNDKVYTTVKIIKAKPYIGLLSLIEFFHYILCLEQSESNGYKSEEI